MSPTRPAGGVVRYLALLVPLSVCATASAHTLLRSQGTVTVDRGEVRVELAVSAADFRHTARLPLDDGALSAEGLRDAARAHGEALLAHLALFADGGRRLSGRIAQPRFSAPLQDRVTPQSLDRMTVHYTLRFALTAQPRFLTMRQTLLQDQTGAPVQLVLHVATAERPSRSVTCLLTNRGNPVTVAFRRSPQADAPGDEKAIHIADALHEVRPRIAIGRTATMIGFELPLALAATWQPIERRREDELSASEARAVVQAWRQRAARSASVTVGGREITPTLERLELVSLKGGGAAVNFWTTRLAVRLRYESPAVVEEGRVEWRLFNHGVLRADASIQLGGTERQHRFSTYAPSLAWDGRQIEHRRDANGGPVAD